MIYTELSGKEKVRCDSCGIEIESCGWLAYIDGDEFHVCDGCAPMFRVEHEFRICDVCGAVMADGFLVEDGSLHICEGCFKPWMDENCPDGWRVNEHGDDLLWDGGYYDELIGGEWCDTGIFWTQWY